MTRAADDDPRVRFLGGVYDQDLLNQLYANARTYIHGHSVGGTNPSLLRAMGAGAPVLAFDCEFNREVTADRALLWSSADDMTRLMDDLADDEWEPVLRELSTPARPNRRALSMGLGTDEYEKLLQHLQRSHRGPDRRIEAARS